MPKSPKVRKESSKREREEGRACEERKNPFRKSFRTGRYPRRNEDGNKSKEMKTMITEIREENKVLGKELAAVREDMRGREEKWQAGGRLDEKDKNDRGKDGTKRKEGEEK
jgi:hypothetical protein